MTATLPAPSFDTVVTAVREACDAADAEGHPRPGRAKLAKAIGASEYQVRQALTRLDAIGASEPDQLPPTDLLQDPATGPTSHLLGSQEVVGDDQAPAGAEPAPNASAGGRLVAWLGFVFGSVMSIAANVLHTWLPAATQPPGWSPGIAPQIGAAVWPVGLLLSVEVLSRVTWRPGWLWGLARYGGAGAVALGSAVISYGHVREVLLAWGYGHPGAEVGPLVLDGLMVVSGFALLAMAGGHRRG
ncbi:hypothetical protein [Kibdelosporangium aridum]|uniref:hypothetical protein n=1 Tax=Kibdelosporangium aridum TaxID=2030 RepID=UPI00068C44AF|nr:hypothetical protein [Kibdelosporangium aridum]